MPKVVILSPGQRFGKWTLLAEAPMHVARSGRTEKQWHCRCDCGTGRVLRQASLRQRHTTNCGCAARGLRDKKTGRILKGCGVNNTQFRHGYASKVDKSPEYRVWQKMKARCECANDKRFNLYGGRGITVCERWKTFENFLADMGLKPSPKHSIDRIDNNGNYEPENCRWATAKIQSRNRNFNRKVVHNGSERCLSEWAEVVGLPYKTLHARLSNGWSFERALSTPLDIRYSHPCGS